MTQTSPLSQSPTEAVTPLPALRILPPTPELRESNALLERHLEKTAAFYEKSSACAQWIAAQYKHRLARYYRDWIPSDASICEIGCGDGSLLELLPNLDVTGIDISEIQLETARVKVPHGTFCHGAGETFPFQRKFDYIVISETINLAADVQRIFENLRDCSRSDTRLVVNFYNTLWKPFLKAATALGLKRRQPELNWLSGADVRNLLALADWEVVRKETRMLVPVPFLGIDAVLNRFLAPILPSFGLTTFMVCRPRSASRSGQKPFPFSSRRATKPEILNRRYSGSASLRRKAKSSSSRDIRQITLGRRSSGSVRNIHT